jgi:hypothetical protein
MSPRGRWLNDDMDLSLRIQTMNRRQLYLRRAVEKRTFSRSDAFD